MLLEVGSCSLFWVPDTMSDIPMEDNSVVAESMHRDSFKDDLDSLFESSPNDKGSTNLEDLDMLSVIGEC